MTGLSLRQRFLLIGGLTLIAAVAAIIALVQMEARTASGLRRAAEARGRHYVLALSHPNLTPAEAPERLRALSDKPSGGVVGYCTPEGAFVAIDVGPQYVIPEAQTPYFKQRLAENYGLLPPDPDHILRLCREVPKEGVGHLQHIVPNTTVYISATRVNASLVAFSLIRIPLPDQDGGQLSFIATLSFMGIACLLLTLCVLDALFTLRRGAGVLRAGLARLQEDLRLTVPTPPTSELAEVAEGINALAQHLAESIERERVIERRLEHERRLAGLGRVVAGVAHEVRTPLTGLKLTLQTMARRSLEGRMAADVEVCLGEIGRLERVVISLLLVARREPARKTPVSLSELIDERLAHFFELASKSGVRLRRTGEAVVPGDRDALARVVDNLLKNAIEASPPEGAILVSVEPGLESVRVTVTDEGEGVPADRLDALFEPFFSLKSEGTGLGLFLSRNVVEAHGGRMTYERRAEQTCFTFTLPLEAPDDETTPDPHRR